MVDVVSRAGRVLKRLPRVLGTALVLLVAFSIFQVVLAGFVTPPVTATMLSRVYQHARDEGELRWVTYRPRRWAVDHPAARAAVTSEDGRFFAHRGFDWNAVCGAIAHAQDGGNLRGASTISQQVARNVFLWQGRSWLRKGLEVWYTTWLELLVPKRRILELYLNVAETGPMTFGFEAAAVHWYGRPADELSKEQIGRIAGILPSPRKWDPNGKTAAKRAGFIRSNQAPFPEDPGFDAFLEQWAKMEGPLDCIGVATR